MLDTVQSPTKTETINHFDEVEIFNPATVTISRPDETVKSLDTENNLDFSSNEGAWEQKAMDQTHSVLPKKTFNPNVEASLASSITHDAE